MSTSIPVEAVGPVAGVLFYSILCLSLSLLLFITLVTLREYANYITLLSAFISVSSAASVAQQIDYTVNWRTIRIRLFEEFTRVPPKPLKLANVYGIQAIFFWIQYYCYNVDAMLLLFWAINLAKKMWNPRARQKHTRVLWPSIVAKVTSIVLPGILIGIVQLDFVLERRILQIILGNLCMELSFAFGSVVVIASLIKYLLNRKTLSMSAQYSSGRSGGTSSSNSRQSMEDRWIIFRFTAAFVILSAFEVWLIAFQLLQSQSKDDVVQASKPDLSMDALRTDIFSFIPGVTASAGCFILFGTTAPLRRKYASWFHMLVAKIKMWHSQIHTLLGQPGPLAEISAPIIDFDTTNYNVDRMMSSPLPRSYSPSISGRSESGTMPTIPAEPYVFDFLTPPATHFSIPSSSQRSIRSGSSSPQISSSPTQAHFKYNVTG